MWLTTAIKQAADFRSRRHVVPQPRLGPPGLAGGRADAQRRLASWPTPTGAMALT